MPPERQSREWLCPPTPCWAPRGADLRVPLRHGPSGLALVVKGDQVSAPGSSRALGGLLWVAGCPWKLINNSFAHQLCVPLSSFLEACL